MTAHDPQPFAPLVSELRTLREALLAAETANAAAIEAVHPAHRRSAANLVHYLELRRHDVRDLQERLSAAGLSSLGRAEAHVLASIEDVLGVLARLDGAEPVPPVAEVQRREGRRRLVGNTAALLGAAAASRSTRVMVTLPSEAATMPALVEEMAAAGMDVARINCAHDDPDAWRSMVDAVRTVRRTNGRAVRIAMDLGGPKLRTGPIRPGPRVVRIAPLREPHGHVLAPARIRLTAQPDHVAHDGVVIPVDDPAWASRRRVGDRIEFVDHRGAPRTWTVVEADEHGCVVEGVHTSYVGTGATLECFSGGVDAVAVGLLPEIELGLRVAPGDTLVLTGALDPVSSTRPGDVHRIGCSLPEVFARVRDGEPVWFDDGRIGGVVTASSSEQLEIRITEARRNGSRLKADKGINFPRSDLELDALTAKDLEDLDFVARHADVVNVSFVRDTSDVELIQRELAARNAGDVGLVLKIENARAFERLPELLLTAMRSRKVGVMIARGDLAVEVGFERLAEVQEEILWACEAAHIPTIWATQVLESMARTGRPSRAEITDAAMSDRAECVMLNKGPYVVEAIRALDSILLRMQHHQQKKRSLLRRLSAWDRTSSG